MAAAIVSEISDQLAHRLEVGGVDQLATDALLRDKARAVQVLKMKRQRGRQEPDALADNSCR